MSDLVKSSEGQAITRAASTPRSLKDWLQGPAVLAKINEACSASIKPGDLVRLALVAISRQPQLAECSQASILRALMDAATLGIRPGGTMGRGYLVPRKGECCFDPGWRGLCDIAKRSGAVKRIEAHVVRERDHFEVENGTSPTLAHRPCVREPGGAIIAAYAIAWLADGEVQTEVLVRDDLDKIRAMGARNGPWASWEEEMARKSAVRRLCKYLPFTEEMDMAADLSMQAEMVGTETTPRASMTEKLRARVEPPTDHDDDGVVTEPPPPARRRVVDDGALAEDPPMRREREPGEEG